MMQCIVLVNNVSKLKYILDTWYNLIIYLTKGYQVHQLIVLRFSPILTNMLRIQEVYSSVVVNGTER